MIKELLETRSAVLVDVGPAVGEGDRLLVLSDLTGTKQLYEVDGPGALQRLTDLPEPVSTARYVPGGRLAVLQVDSGGNERYQLYVIDLDAARTEPVTDVRGMVSLTDQYNYAHPLAGVAPDGQTVAYLSNARNGVDFDLWTCDLAGEQRRCLYDGGGYCFPSSGFSPDGRWVAVQRPGPRPLDLDLLLIDASSGEVYLPMAHEDQAAEVGGPAWVGRELFYFAANVGSDFKRLWLHDRARSSTSPAAWTTGTWDIEVITNLSGDAVCTIENRNGSSRVSVGAPGHNALAVVPLAEEGVVHYHNIGLPQFSYDGTRLYYTLSSARLAGDVWSYDVRSGQTTRLTQSPTAVPTERLAQPSRAQVKSFDGETVPVLIYRPLAPASPPPVVVVVHGGPEGQAVVSFNAIAQYLVTAGYAVVVPNVRGSTGYGKRFASLDDTIKRLDSVKDLEALHGALSEWGLDDDRAALWGGSYGGYMVLAGLAFQPQLWAAGVDIVGISDLVTFLENTSAYRRAVRELEYGSLEHDREFLASASPLRRSGSIRAPLFVIHGRNDPRVPVGEAEQLAAALEQNGVRCELLIYEDEGHGLVRLANRLDAYPKAVAFLEEVLRPGAN